MEAGHGLLDRADDRDVVVAVERRVDPALEAHLGRAALPGLDRAAHDLLVRHQEGRAAQVGRELPLREGAEAAAEVADVRVLDVPGHDVGHLVAVDIAAERIGCREHALPLLAARAEQAHDLLLAELVARTAGDRVAADDEGDLAGLARRPGVLAGQPERVGGAQNPGKHLGVDPLGVDVARVDGEARRELEAAALGRGAEQLELGPRRLRVDVIDRHRRDAAPVVDPGVEQRSEVLGQVRRRLDRDPGRQDQPRCRDRPQQLLERRLRCLRHPRAGLGPEVLDDHLLHLRSCGRDRLERLDPLGARLADADQDAGGERHARLAGEAERLEACGRQLVGRAEVRATARREPRRRGLEHHPHRGRDRPQQLEVGCREHARVQVRQERGLLEHRPRGVREVLERRREPERRQLLARCPVAQLGLVPEREQRLAAAGPLAGPGHLEHLVDRHVGALAPPRRPRKRAVVAYVAAELRQRNEHLRAVGDERSAPRCANRARRSHQLCKWTLETPRRHRPRQ